VKTLQSLLGLGDEQVISLVVFVGDSTFKTPMPDNVTYGGGYIRFIKSRKDEVLSETEVQDIVSKIENGRLAATFRNHRQHVAHVNSIVEKKASVPRCPKC